VHTYIHTYIYIYVFENILKLFTTGTVGGGGGNHVNEDYS